jgi:peptidoglycan/LPS O-acetylase OafA/YrhL
MAVPTRRTSPAVVHGNLRAVWAVVLGLLSAATMPVAVVATRYSGSYDLLHAGFAIPVAMAFGAGALATGRSAQRHDVRSLERAGGRRLAKLGRALGILGFCLATSALIALAVYGFLTYLEDQ